MLYVYTLPLYLSAPTTWTASAQADASSTATVSAVVRDVASAAAGGSGTATATVVVRARAIVTAAGGGTGIASAILREIATGAGTGSGAATATPKHTPLGSGTAAGIGSANATAVLRLRASGTLAGVGTAVAYIGAFPASASAAGLGTATVTARVRAVARAVTAGVGSASGTAITPTYYAAPGSIRRSGQYLALAAENPMALEAESNLLSIPLADADVLAMAIDKAVLSLVAEANPLVLSSNDQAPTMSLIHPVSVDPVEQIFLKISAQDLLIPAVEQITNATFTASSQAILDGHSLITSYYDATRYMFGFQPTGGIAGSQYAWTLVWNTTDVDGRTQKRKRTIMVNVATK